EVARRAAQWSGIASARHTNPRTGLHAGGNSHLQGFSAAHPAFPGASAADGPQAPRAPTALAGDVEAHAPARLRDVAGAAAGSTDLLRPAQRSRSAALAASIQAQDRGLFHRAAHCFPEIDFDWVFEIDFWEAVRGTVKK